MVGTRGLSHASNLFSLQFYILEARRNVLDAVKRLLLKSSLIAHCRNLISHDLVSTGSRLRRASAPDLFVPVFDRQNVLGRADTPCLCLGEDSITLSMHEYVCSLVLNIFLMTISWFTQVEQTWTGIPVATTQGEQSYIKGNTKYMAVAVQVR